MFGISLFGWPLRGCNGISFNFGFSSEFRNFFFKFRRGGKPACIERERFNRD